MIQAKIIVTLQVNVWTKDIGATLLQEKKPIAFASKAVTVGVKSVKDLTNLMNVDVDVDAESPYANTKTC